MATVPTPIRTTCSTCGNRCRVQPIELLVHEHRDGLRFWRWIYATLCPPCRLAKYDWVLDPKFRTERAFV